MPRRRGRASLGQSWPVIRALRRERFDRSVDFAGNDRGAILSLLIGARRRLGWTQPGGFFGRRFCYNQRVPSWKSNWSTNPRGMANLLAAWNITRAVARSGNPRRPRAGGGGGKNFCRTEKSSATSRRSQPKKEWPLAHWAEFYRLAAAAGWRVDFHHRDGAARAIADGRFEKTSAGRAGAAGDSRTAAVSGRGEARGGFHFRRHRPAAFCRRSRRADDCAVRPHARRALGAGWPAPPDFDRRPMRLRRQFRRLPRRKPLPRGHFAGTGFRRGAIRVERRKFQPRVEFI